MTTRLAKGQFVHQYEMSLTLGVVTMARISAFVNKFGKDGVGMFTLRELNFDK